MGRRRKEEVAFSTTTSCASPASSGITACLIAHKPQKTARRPTHDFTYFGGLDRPRHCGGLARPKPRCRCIPWPWIWPERRIDCRGRLGLWHVLMVISHCGRTWNFVWGLPGSPARHGVTRRSISSMAWLQRMACRANRKRRTNRAQQGARGMAGLFISSDGHIDQPQGCATLGIAFHVRRARDHQLATSFDVHNRVGNYHLCNLWNIWPAVLHRSRTKPLSAISKNQRSAFWHVVWRTWHIHDQ